MIRSKRSIAADKASGPAVEPLPGPETAACLSDGARLAQVLMLTAGRDDPPPHTHFDGLAVELRISDAVFDPGRGELEVRGWCLTPQASFWLFVEVPDVPLVVAVTPNTGERRDLLQRYPQYGNADAGWHVSVPVVALSAEASLRAVYLGRGRQVEFAGKIRIIETAPPPETKADVTLPPPGIPATREIQRDILTVTTATYSPRRGLCVVRGTLTSGREDVTFSLRLASGGAAREQSVRIGAADDAGRRDWVVTFPLAGMADRETVIVTTASDGADDMAGEACLALTDLKDSDRRTLAVTASVAPGEPAVAGHLTLTDFAVLCDLPQATALAGKVPGEVCYFPPFETIEDLSNHVHRARWYLCAEGTPVTQVTARTAFSQADILPPDPFMASAPDSPLIRLSADNASYLQALARAEAVLVWRPLPAALADLLASLLGKPRVVTIATSDPSAREFRNYARLPWLMLPPERKTALLAESRTRFAAALAEQRALGKTRSAVFGTGPSLDRAFKFDFGACMTIACNSIVASDALLDHIRPAFLTAGDAVSHVGVSAYAAAFRADLVRAVVQRGLHVLTTADIGFQLALNCPEIRHRLILCEQGFSGLNADLENVWSLPRSDSTLNIHMLPVAATFSDTIYMLGLDGQSPDPVLNEDFWPHSAAAQYHDLVMTGHLAHPTFAANRAAATEARYLASVEDSLSAGEAIGKTFWSLAPSHTPAIAARPAPAGALRPGAAEMPETRPLKGRALIVVQSGSPEDPRESLSGDGEAAGRLAALLAQAMTDLCAEVVLWADHPPQERICPRDGARGRLRVRVNDFIAPPEGQFDFVFLLSDHAQPAASVIALELAQRASARVILVSLTTPNLINALTPAYMPLAAGATAFAIACFADAVLSATNRALPFAEAYFRTLFHRPHFAALPSAIDPAAAEAVPPQDRLPTGHGAASVPLTAALSRILAALDGPSAAHAFSPEKFAMARNIRLGDWGEGRSTQGYEVG